SEDALGLRFTGRHAEDLRYTASMGNWHRWTGQQWLEDGTLEVFDLARKICRNAASDCPNGGIARQIAKASTVAAVERLARADRRHSMTIDRWDSDLWALNTPSGILDLKTGELSAHRREDRKSTRLNSSHLGISYAVFCLK